MKIAWFTVRKWADFCATTTNALAHGMVANGHALTMLNPDASAEHHDAPWAHVPLEQNGRRGFQARSLAKSGARWLSNVPNATDFDVILVDWQLLPTLIPALAQLNRPVVLVDRSPPADAGLLGKLQWNVWKRAWQCLRRGRIQAGTVVSQAHADFVEKKAGVRASDIYTLPAGVDVTTFQTQNTPSTPLRAVYHGRLDKNRGVLALPMLVHLLRQDGVDAELTLIGDGDSFPALKEMQTERPWMNLVPTLAHEDLPAVLAQHHVGLLPMPATKVWQLASPLKRSEYLAAGLLVLGIDHDGHRLKGANEAWYRLLAKEDFLTDGVVWLKQLNKDRLAEGRMAARSFAESFCSWDSSVNMLENLLQSSNQDA
jgi:glycosyltransferase involved in cell wall biosynthesis